jgi:hypothetical protein
LRFVAVVVSRGRVNGRALGRVGFFGDVISHWVDECGRGRVVTLASASRALTDTVGAIFR